MDLGDLATLAGLALVDSTSFGTLVLPVLALLAHRRASGRVTAHLAVIGAFYWVLGAVLLLGGEAALEATGGWPPVLTHPITLIAGGVALVALSYVVDGTVTLPAPLAERSRRTRAWMRHAIGPGAGLRTIVAVAVVAGAIEALSMLPYLGALGILLHSDLPTPGRMGALAAYCALMCLPGLLVVGLRAALGRHLDGPLERLGGWFERNGAREAGWIVGILGVVLAVHGIGRLNGG